MKKVCRIMIICFLICGLSGCGSVSRDTSKEEGYDYYYCDVKNFNFKTKIEIEKEGKQYGEVSGDILRFVTDPLTMYDTQGNNVAYAGDSYHFINQDSHGIYVNNDFTYDMVGLFKVFGESYEIYDKNEKLVANITFNVTNTSGKMHNAEGKLIAEYESEPFFNDYSVKIYDECEIDEISAIMIFASYYSDYAADR